MGQTRRHDKAARLNRMSSIKRSVNIAGHATSVTLEPEFWDCLKDIAERKNSSINSLITQIDEDKAIENLSSAIRIYILNELISNQT